MNLKVSREKSRGTKECQRIITNTKFNMEGIGKFYTVSHKSLHKPMRLKRYAVFVAIFGLPARYLLYREDVPEKIPKITNLRADVII